MSVAPRLERPPNPLTELLNRLGAILFTVTFGIVLGLQYITPNKRVLSVILALLMFGLPWRLDLITGLGIMAIALPFPHTTIFGNTNLAFILLMIVTWLLRVTMRQNAPPHRSPIDAPLISLFISYVASFYNVTAGNLGVSLGCFEMMMATWLMFYLVASIPQTQRDFHRLLGFQAVSVLLVCLTAVFEMTFPGRPLIPGWIELGSKMALDANNVRVGSAFHDYELLCEYCAISAPLILFLFLRTNSILLRTAYGGLLVLVVFVLFSTVTRGGAISLAVGLLYLTWLVRRRLSMVAVTITAGATAAGLIGMNWFVVTFTHTGNLFERMAGSKFKGLLPDTRAVTWPEAWDRIFEHPFLGHGPNYAVFVGTRAYYFPHSLYLYVANNVGFIGFAIFAWLLWIMFRTTRPTTDDLRHADFVRSYMVIARTQMVVFLVDEIKIEYLRNDVYAFQIWMMFALMVAGHRLLGPDAAHVSPADAHRRAPLGAPPSARSVTS